MSKDNDNKIHTVYIDGVPCHWQVMRQYRPEGSKLVCIRFVNLDVDMTDADKKKFEKIVDVKSDFKVDENDIVALSLKTRFSLNESDMARIYDVIEDRMESEAAYKLLAELEKEDGYVCD